MQIRFIPCLIFHIYKSEKSGGWVRMMGGGGNIARGVKQDIAHRDTLIQQTSEARRRHVTNAFNTYVVCQKSSCTPFIFSTEK